MSIKAVQIVDSDGDNKFVFNEKALRDILMQEDVRNRYVSVVSIAGALREGKSFLLNFLLRYLNIKCSSKKLESWLDAENGPIKGFSWRGGSKRDTVGILMWPEVFLTETADGQKIAVILLDTQGSFDNQSTMSNSAGIFALSTLISSVQIYNLMRNIKQDDLAHLECFAGLGKFIKNDTTPFQKLLFLVRDWPWPHEKPFGYDGGKQLLKEVLNTETPSKLNARKENIRQLFSEIRCFLLAHPGPAVDGQETFNGDLDDISEDFLEGIEILVPKLLDDKHLEIKTINGQKIRASELFFYIKEYTKVFQSGELPEVQSMFIATSEANHKAAFEESLSLYKELMRSLLKEEVFFEDSELENRGTEIEAEVLEKFLKRKKIGDEQMNRKYENLLIEAISDKFSNFMMQNRQNREIYLLKVELEAKNSSDSSINLYRASMDRFMKTDTYFEDFQIDYEHQKFKRESICDFEQKTKGPKSEYRLKCKKQLEESLDLMHEEYKEKNKIARQVEWARIESKLKTLSTESLQIYHDYMKHNMQKQEAFLRDAFLQTKQAEAKEKAFDHYKSKTVDIVKEQQLCLRYLKDLERILDSSFSIYKNENVNRRDAYLSKAKVYFMTAYEDALSSYRESMQDLISAQSNQISNEILTARHAKFSEHARDQYNKNFMDGFESTQAKYYEKLEQALKDEFEAFKSINQSKLPQLLSPGRPMAASSPVCFQSPSPQLTYSSSSNCHTPSRSYSSQGSSSSELRHNNSWLNYLSEYRQANPGMRNQRDVMRNASAEWRQMDASSKSFYKKK